MALKQYEIAFNLAAKKSGTFTKSFKDAGQTVEGLQAHMERMNASFAEITGAPFSFVWATLLIDETVPA